MLPPTNTCRGAGGGGGGGGYKAIVYMNDCSIHSMCHIKANIHALHFILCLETDSFDSGNKGIHRKGHLTYTLRVALDIQLDSPRRQQGLVPRVDRWAAGRRGGIRR